MHQAIEGFRGETFSVEQYLPQAEVTERARLQAERIVDVTASIADVLDAEQRVALAERIHEAAVAREGTPDETIEQAPTDKPKGAESVGTATQHLWAGAAVRRGPFGGVRGGVVVGRRGPRGQPGMPTAGWPRIRWRVGYGYGW